MSYLPKLFQIIDSIFAGTNLDQMRNDTITLLYQLIEEGEDDEIPDTIKEICQSIVSVMEAKGKKVDPDACYDMIYSAVMEERAKLRARMAMMKMRRRRRRRSSYEL